MLDLDGPFGWKPHAHHVDHVLSKVGSVEQQTFQELIQAGSHSISPKSLCRQAQKRLAKLDFEEYADVLFSIRLKGKLRVYSIRQGREMFVLWLDPEHQVCPSKKKHT